MIDFNLFSSAPVGGPVLVRGPHRAPVRRFHCSFISSKSRDLLAPFLGSVWSDFPVLNSDCLGVFWCRGPELLALERPGATQTQSFSDRNFTHDFEILWNSANQNLSFYSYKRRGLGTSRLCLLPPLAAVRSINHHHHQRSHLMTIIIIITTDHLMTHSI